METKKALHRFTEDDVRLCEKCGHIACVATQAAWDKLEHVCDECAEDNNDW